MRHRILVVAEDVTLRSTLARWLMPAGYFVELAETDKRAREVLADGRMALTIVAPSAGVPMFDPGEKGGKLIIATERPLDPGGLSRSAPVADAYLSIPLDQQDVLARVESVLRPSPGAKDAALQVPEILSFDGFTIDLAGRSLRDCGGSEVPLTRTEFALLVVLARHAGRVLSRDQLLDAALGRRSEPYDRSVDVLVGRLRRKIEPDPKAPRFIITMPGEGYKFAAQLRENRLRAQTTFDAPAEEEPSAPSTERRQTTVISSVTGGAPTRATLPLPDKPSIAVLPFENLSGDPEQEYFADGMVEEIITALSRIRWLFVIARNSSFTYKGQSVDARQIGRELGVRYLLEGSVRSAGDRVRITAQLIETETGAHLWADRFDGSLENVFELQDRVAISVAGVIEPTLEAAEFRISSKRPTSDLTAYDLYLRALPRAAIRETDQALGLLVQAIERDPQYGPALALAAHCCFDLDVYGRTDDRETNRRRGVDLARRALRCAPGDPAVLANAAIVLGYFGEDMGAPVALIDRALALNPSYAAGWYWSGVLRNWVGRPDIALEHFATFHRLSPRDRFPFGLTGIGIALFFTRRFEEAAAKLLESLEQLPDHPLTYRFLAACYAQLGRRAEAREIVKQLSALTSVVLDSGARYRNPRHRELYLSGLRLAIGESS